MNASDVVSLIAARHTNDVFVPECKDGPTWGGGAMRLDAWAMRKSGCCARSSARAAGACSTSTTS